jgi:mRNA interferase MazF
MTPIHRGDVWLVSLDPTMGAEIKKTRPAVVISNDIANQYAATITVFPVTDRGDKVFPVEVEIPVKTGGLIKPSKIKCQQIRTVDKLRLVRFLGVLSDRTVHAVERALCLHLAIDPSVHP